MYPIEICIFSVLTLQSASLVFSLTIDQAEVQSIYSDGSLSLHTRSLKYGKVGIDGHILEKSITQT